MRRNRLWIPAAVSLLAGALVLQQTARGTDHGVPITGTPPAGPLGATPTGTVSPRSAQVLMAQAIGISAARGSVLEYGSFHSSKNDIFDGFTFWANYSWQHQTFRDWHTFAKAAFLSKALGYATQVRRAASGPWVSQRVHGRWSCSHSTTTKNSLLWASPNFPLQSLRLIGNVSVNGRAAWDVRGLYLHKFNGETGRFQVDVFIGQQSGLFLRATDSGRVSARSGKAARVTGKVSYSAYGKPVLVRLPAVCKS
jgi:hypothetical protein